MASKAALKATSTDDRDMNKFAAERAKKAKKTQATAAAPATIDAYNARYDLDTLTRAEEIKGDKGRHKAAMGEAKRQQKNLSSIMTPRRKRRLDKADQA